MRSKPSPPLKRAGDQAQPGGGLSCGFPREPLSEKSASNRHPQANHPPLTRSPFLFKEGQRTNNQVPPCEGWLAFCQVANRTKSALEKGGGPGAAWWWVVLRIPNRASFKEIIIEQASAEQPSTANAVPLPFQGRTGTVPYSSQA